MAAHEGSEHAGQAERRNIGDTALEQLHADVGRLSHDYMTGEPLPLFFEMRRVRNRIHAVLDHRLWPRDAADLYLMAGCLNCLMASAAKKVRELDQRIEDFCRETIAGDLRALPGGG